MFKPKVTETPDEPTCTCPKCDYSGPESEFMDEAAPNENEKPVKQSPRGIMIEIMQGAKKKDNK